MQQCYAVVLLLKRAGDCGAVGPVRTDPRPESNGPVEPLTLPDRRSSSIPSAPHSLLSFPAPSNTSSRLRQRPHHHHHVPPSPPSLDLPDGGLPLNTPTMASTTAPIPRGTIPRPRPMSLPAPTYSASHSGTSSDRARQYAEQPHAAAQRQSQRAVDPTTRPRTTNRILGDYTLSKTLGAGSMGKVKLAHHNLTGEKVCTSSILFSYQRFCHRRNLFSFPAPSLLIFDVYHGTTLDSPLLTAVTVV